MPKTYNELNDLVEKQNKIIIIQQRTIDTLVNALNSKEDKITENNKLESDLVDDTNQVNKFVTEQDKTSWNGKQNQITSSNKLESDLVDDTNQTNKFVSEQDKTSWNGKSVVVANPTLTGTEEALEGIEVNGVKFKAGGGDKLYKHRITFAIGTNSNYNNFMYYIYNYSPTRMTNDEIKTFVMNNKYLFLGKILQGFNDVLYLTNINSFGAYYINIDANKVTDNSVVLSSSDQSYSNLGDSVTEA